MFYANICQPLMICMLLVEMNQMPAENSMYTLVYTHIVAQCCTHTQLYIYIYMNQRILSLVIMIIFFIYTYIYMYVYVYAYIYITWKSLCVFLIVVLATTVFQQPRFPEIGVFSFMPVLWVPGFCHFLSIAVMNLRDRTLEPRKCLA